MTGALVPEIFENWGHLDHRPFRLFVFMVSEAKIDASPTYEGGREALAEALGYVEAGRPKTRYYNVTHTLRVLRDAGAISLVAPGSFRGPSLYALFPAGRLALREVAS